MPLHLKNRSKQRRKPKRDKKKAKSKDPAHTDASFGRDRMSFGDWVTGDYFLQRRKEYEANGNINPVESELYPGAKAANLL